MRAAQAVAADLDQLNDTLAEESIANIPEDMQGGSECIAMSRKNSVRRAGLMSRRTSNVGPGSKRMSLAAAGPSISGQRFSMQASMRIY